MTPSLEGWPSKAKEAPSPDEVRLRWTPTQYLNVLGRNMCVYVDRCLAIYVGAWQKRKGKILSEGGLCH